MATRRKTTPRPTHADPDQGSVITGEPVIQGAPVSEDFPEKVEQTMTEVAGEGQERISLPLGLMPDQEKDEGQKSEPPIPAQPVIQGLPVSTWRESHFDPSPGKPGLPDPEPEFAGLPYGGSEDTYEADAEEECEEITSFTDNDRNDFACLERQIDAGTRKQAEALREIRCRQLWRLEQDGQGNQRYASFQAYCQDRWGHPRQWVTHLTNWLRVVEEGERLGIPVPLTVKAAQGLLIGRLQAAGGLRAVLEEAKEDGVPLDRDHLREIVLRRADFNLWSETEGPRKPAARTYAEYKQDLATVKQLADGPTDHAVVGKAKDLDGAFADNLLALCRQERVLPMPGHLLGVLTGQALQDVVAGLLDVARDAADIEEKKRLLAARRKQIRAMQQEGGLRQLKEEARTLERELEDQGVLKKRSRDAQPEPPPQDEAPSIRVVLGHDEEISEEGEVSEVRQSLALALQNLEDAFTADSPEDTDELNAILIVAQDCGSKLVEIIAKVKDCLVNTEEPEGVPNGHD